MACSKNARGKPPFIIILLIFAVFINLLEIFTQFQYDWTTALVVF